MLNRCCLAMAVSLSVLSVACGASYPGATSAPPDAGTNAGTDAGTAVHPACGLPPWIVFPIDTFSDDGGVDFELAAVHPDGSDRRYLTVDHPRPTGVIVSPDAKTLLYTVDFIEPDGESHVGTLYAIDLTTGVERTVITTPPGNDFNSMSFSPDQKLLAFSETDDIHLAAADGSDDQDLLQGPQDEASEYYVDPQFSADGTSLSFNVEGHTFETMKLDGSGRHVLAYGSTEAWMGTPAFSPTDPTLFVAPFVCQGVRTFRALRTTDAPNPSDPCAAGRVIAQIPSGLFSSALAWGPAGQIAYSLQEPTDGGPELERMLRLVDFATGAVTKVTEEQNIGAPFWTSGCAQLPFGEPF